MKSSLCVVLSVVALVLVGCGAAELGESCDTVGSTDDCVDGAICGLKSGQKICMKSCNTALDCPVNHSCAAIEKNSTKTACRLNF